MHLDLVDHLRCPREHPGLDGTVALVCVPVRIDGRILHEAMLGCPTCHAQFAVIDGVMVFGDDLIVFGDGATGARPAPPDHGARGSADARGGAGAAGDVAPHADLGVAPNGETADELVRRAALRNLDGPGGFVLLHADWGVHAGALATAFDISVVTLDAPASVARDPGDAGDARVSTIISSGGRVPLAHGVLRGVALGLGVGGALPAPALLVSAGLAVMPNGRLVAPIGCEPPPAWVELDRDPRHWVAEARSTPVTLRHAPRPPPPHTPGR